MTLSLYRILIGPTSEQIQEPLPPTQPPPQPPTVPPPEQPQQPLPAPPTVEPPLPNVIPEPVRPSAPPQPIQAEHLRAAPHRQRERQSRSYEEAAG
jgi:hypothetical protein